MTTLPDKARQRGFTKQALATRFTSLAAVDAKLSGAGFDWYPRATAAMGPQQDPTRLKIVQDATEGAVLRIDPDVASANWSLASLDVKTGRGRTFRYGYFTARLRFTPQPYSNVWPRPAAWPSFWLTSPSAWDSPVGTKFAELDIFEQLAGEKTVQGSLHEWKHDTADGHLWADHSAFVGRLDGWHDYGVLWEPGRVMWFFDGKPVSTRTYGRGVTVATGGDTAWTAIDGTKVDALPEGTFSGLDDPLVLIIGTGPGAPLDVHSITVWTA